jgi:hypothetical protein
MYAFMCGYICVWLAQDVAIHYRCGDNIHSSGMGLMRFPALQALVPARAQHVYVLSEDQSRKTSGGEAGFCAEVLASLHAFLAEAFPDKTIVTLRGALIFDDMTRIALAPTAIASISSFSLFPAITNKNRSYYPAMPKHKHGLFENHQVRA